MRKPRQPSTRPSASVQQQLVRVREIVGGVLCVWSPLSPTKRSYRAVIEVGTINFLLKAEEEQSVLVEQYRLLIKALSFPVQIIIRNQRLDLRPYLVHLQAQIPPEEHTQWAVLAESQAELLHQIGSQRTLIERHCYLVVPAPDPQTVRRWGFPRTRTRTRHAALMGRAVQDLAIRVETLQQQLMTLRLPSRRLGGEELAQLYQSCLTPERALLHPLSSRHLQSVGHFPRVRPAPRALLVPPDRGVAPLVVPLTPDTRVPRVTEVPPRRSRPHRPEVVACEGAPLPAPDFLRLADLLAPASLLEERDHLRVGDEWVRAIAVTAFPREVSDSGWLAPLLMLDELFDLCLHLHPQSQTAMMRQLRRRRVGYGATNGLNRQRGRQEDLEMSVAHQDVTRLMSKLAIGGEKIFEVSFLLLARGPSLAALDERSERLLSVLQTVFLDAVAHVTSYEQAQALRSCLPEGRDELGRTMTLDTASVATTFPFMSNALLMPGGTFLGVTSTGEPVLLNPWDPSLENPHAFIGGSTGAGKSVVGKLWMIRSLFMHGKNGEQALVIDPDGEWGPVVEAVGGVTVRIAAGSPYHLNPFDLLPPGCDLPTYLEEVQKEDRLGEKILDLLSLLDLMLADHGSTLGASARSLLDRALYETYRRVGITLDPATHFHQPPLLRDLADVLASNVCGADAFDLGVRLARYIDGSLASLFAEQTNVRLDAHVLHWDIREMRGDLRAIGIFLIADTIWTQSIRQSHRKRALYLDEATSIISHPEGARFLADLSRRARKRYLRLVTMTQNPEQFVLDEHGSTVVANSSIKLLKKQDPTSVKAVASRFGLTHGEEQRLLSFGVQDALLLAGDRRVLLSVRASAPELALITTNPVELAAQAVQRQAEQQEGQR